MDDSDAFPPAPTPFGVFADTGRPFDPLSSADIASFLHVEAKRPLEAPLTRSLRDRTSTDEISFGTVADVDPKSLADSGWAVVFAQNTPFSVKEALQPLLDRRKSQVGDALFRTFEGPEAPEIGESPIKWLSRHNVSLNVVNPAQGVPYYVLFVGSPEQISFEFQYTIDLYWAVGRLFFETAEEYANYANTVISYETASTIPHSRRVAVFAPTHPFDRATQMFTRDVANSLLAGGNGLKPLGERQMFKAEGLLSENATKKNMTELLRGRLTPAPPAVLFSGSHGMGFRLDDTRLIDNQGALVCQDWKGYGAISEDEWFSWKDVPNDARIHGLIYFCFACYGGGCPQFDNFQRAANPPTQIAPKALIARLPQSLLSWPAGGALAVVAHVDRAWAYSFVGTSGSPQVQGFYDVLAGLFLGDRVGVATDRFNTRWAALSTELSDTLDRKSQGQNISDNEIASAWVARDDARNYVLLGDPAVRLRVEDMPNLF